MVEELVAFHRLGKLREKLLRSNTVVSGRLLGTSGAISRQLYQLTAGLAREGAPTQVVLALWEELLGSKLAEEVTKKLEESAERINACLTEELRVDPTREDELRAAVSEYHSALGEHVGERASRITMLTRAVPDVARVIRESDPSCPS